MKSNQGERIVFIIVDTLRADYLRLYGGKSKTPNIDLLAKESAYFTNAYASITKTDPSITSIMLGKYPVKAGLINHGRHVTEPEEKNLKQSNFLAEILKSNGYKTMAVDWLGRWHKRGFDFYSGHILKKQYEVPIYDNPFKFAWSYNLRFFDKLTVKFLRRDFIARLYYLVFKKWKRPYYDPANKVADKAINLLSKKNNHKKLFLYLHFWDTHYPHMHPNGVWTYLKSSIKTSYESEVEFVDQELGRLINYLKKSGQYEQTLIIFTSDHGENFYEHDIPLNHENLYQDVVHVPLIIKSPNWPRVKITSLVQHVDILPTLLDLLKISKPNDLDGLSLVPWLRQKNKGPRRQYVFFEDIVQRGQMFLKTFRRRGILANGFKYIEKLEGGKHLFDVYPSEEAEVTLREFYNLRKDPYETDNIFRNNKHEARLQERKLNQITKKLNLAKLKDSNPLLYRKYQNTIKIIKKAYLNHSEIAIAWKGGKDTTVMMHVIKSIYGQIPFKVFFNDTTLEFKETYEFIEKMKKLWNLDMVVIKHDEKELEEYHQTKDLNRKKELSRLMKITAINKALKKYKFKGFMLGIRRDENEARKKEKYFSKRSDHIRIHPLLDWTEQDIWDYINIFGVPYNVLYDQGYRSVGEKPFTSKSAKDERSGRDQEKEKVMADLRKMGYW